MNLVKARTMPGVMELLPMEQIAFQKMLDTIRDSYERFGFLPVETPVLEFRDVLLTKTGGETERQVYFAQSTGARAQGRDPELAMRFDLTVPLARYVAEHEKKLVLPFRRYQIQRVYRGESAQRGRYREFYQCDIDVIGKDRLSLQYDAEIPMVIYHVFKRLNVGKFTIHMNNRKIMLGFFSSLGIESERQGLILREVDKLDKRSRDKVVATLTSEEFALAEDVVHQIMDLIAPSADSNRQLLAKLKAMDLRDETFLEGLDELEQVAHALEAAGIPDDHYRINLAIARGLDYYTGTVYETLLDEHPQIGSVCSGGRYENLAGHYTKSKLPGVGISIGATRLFYQLLAAGLIQADTSTVAVLVTQMDDKLGAEYLKLASTLRQHGINTVVGQGGQKFGKQLKYADRASIRFAVIMGEDELAKGMVTVKDLARSEQFEVGREELPQAIRQRMDS